MGTRRTLLALIALGGLSTGATAQVPLPEMGAATDGNTVLEFTSGGGLVSLTVNAATAGSEPTSVTDNSTEIHWINGIGTTAKLTASTVCPGQSFSLSVDIQITSFGSGTQATAQPTLSLVDGMMATDLLRDISALETEKEGTALLTYTASATVANGTSADNGDDYHTVTYTLLEQ